MFKRVIILASITVMALGISMAQPPKAHAWIEGATIETCFWAGITVTYGANSACVKVAQTALNEQDQFFGQHPEVWPHLAIDGIYGPQTRKAIAAFQYFYTLPQVNGTVDPPTWASMYSGCKQAEVGFGFLSATCQHPANLVWM